MTIRLFICTTSAFSSQATIHFFPTFTFFWTVQTIAPNKFHQTRFLARTPAGSEDNKEEYCLVVVPTEIHMQASFSFKKDCTRQLGGVGHSRLPGRSNLGCVVFSHTPWCEGAGVPKTASFQRRIGVSARAGTPLVGFGSGLQWADISCCTAPGVVKTRALNPWVHPVRWHSNSANFFSPICHFFANFWERSTVPSPTGL